MKKFVSAGNPGQNIWNIVKKFNKTEQKHKLFDTWFCVIFTKSTAIAKIVFLERRQANRLFFYSILKFLLEFLCFLRFSALICTVTCSATRR